MAVTQVTGVKETIRELRQLEPRLAREAVKSIKAPALPTAAALRAIAPAVPLSHMGYYGPTKVSTNFGGRPRRSAAANEFPLVRIRLVGPGWTASSDMARRNSPGESMTTNLQRKYGSASRWAWPTVEQRIASIQAAILKAVKDVERMTNAAMMGRM